MRAALSFTKYFKNAHRNLRTTFARFQARPQASFNHYKFFSYFVFGTLIIKHDNLLSCANLAEEEENLRPDSSRNRLLFIRSKNSKNDNIEQFIEGLKSNGVDVIEVSILFKMK